MLFHLEIKMLWHEIKLQRILPTISKTTMKNYKTERLAIKSAPIKLAARLRTAFSMSPKGKILIRRT